MILNNSRRYVKKKSFLSFYLVCLSPIFSFPVLLYNIYHKNKVSLYLMSFIFGGMSFAYIPAINADRTRHFERFAEISHLKSLSHFVEYITDNSLPDFLIYYMMYLFSYFTSDPRWLYFFCTSFTFYSLSLVMLSIGGVEKLSKKWFFFSFLLLLFVFPYLDSFSGLRFAFAMGILGLGVYCLIFKKNRFLGFLALFLSVFTHFATVVMMGAVLTVYFFPKLNYRLLFYISLFFIFITGSQILSLMALLPIKDTAYFIKATVYLEVFDLLGDAAKTAPILKMILFFKKTWVFLFAVYLFFNVCENKRIESFVLSVIIFRNLFAGMPTVVAYYDKFALFMCILLLIKGLVESKRRFFYPLFVFFMLNFLMDIYISRQMFLLTNFSTKNIISLTIFMDEIPKPIMSRRS